MTQVERRMTVIEYCRQQVMQLLELDEDAYAWHKYRAGLEYLRIYTRNDEAAIWWLEREKVFWAWWKNHWAMREEEFINLAWSRPSHIRHHIYAEMNDPHLLAREITPNGRILGDSYAVMIGKCTQKHGVNAV